MVRVECLCVQCKMGLITSREQTMLDGPVASAKSHHVRQPSTRNRTKPPMPDRDELENRFVKVLVSVGTEFCRHYVYKHNIVYRVNGRRYFYYATVALATMFKQYIVNNVLPGR